jgi:hypothetical protein
MIRRLSLLVLVALVWCAVSANAPAVEPLSTRSFSINRSNNIFTTEQFNLEVEFGDSLFFPNPTSMLFPNLAITPASVGQTFTSLPGNPGFADAEARLTDTLNQAIRFVMTETASLRAEKRGYAENLVLNTPALTPDFAGTDIRKFTLHIDSFNLASGPPAGAQPAAVGSMPVDLKFTFSVWGVPEPSTATMGAGALAMLALRRYSGRRKLAR